MWTTSQTSIAVRNVVIRRRMPSRVRRRPRDELDGKQREHRVERELALEEPEAEEEAAPVRAVAREPDQRRRHERRDVAAVGREDLRRDPGDGIAKNSTGSIAT